MIGYWSSSCPVKTDNEKVLATVYAKTDKVLISIASWAENSVSCHLSIDYSRLGFGSDRSKLSAPDIDGFQEGCSFGMQDEIPVEPGRGWLFILE